MDKFSERAPFRLPKCPAQQQPLLAIATSALFSLQWRRARLFSGDENLCQAQILLPVDMIVMRVHGQISIHESMTCYCRHGVQPRSHVYRVPRFVECRSSHLNSEDRVLPPQGYPNSATDRLLGCQARAYSPNERQSES